MGMAFFRELVLTEISRLLTSGLYLIVDSLWPLWEGPRCTISAPVPGSCGSKRGPAPTGPGRPPQVALTRNRGRL